METDSDHAPHSLGRWGEGHAARYLTTRGWTVLARNYRFGRREVDLVVRRGDLVAFVEVKTRAGAGYGSPLEAITRLKRREVEAVAADFLRRHGLSGARVRFDAVGIQLRRGARTTLEIEHVEDAWRPGWP
jgi:putative endonuclease